MAQDFAGRYPHEVSGGQCQRAAIARALAIKPMLLICDEATSALDVTIQEEILELLSKLRRERGEGLSILFICHDIALVQQFCERMEGFLGVSPSAGVAAESGLWWAFLVEVLRAVGRLLWRCDSGLEGEHLR
jgi:ABC-type antimicrobial peptide transport system ATPase subunit